MRRVSTSIPILLLFLSALLVLSFTLCWAGRILTDGEMMRIRGGTGPPTAVAKAEGTTYTAVVLKKQDVSFDGSSSSGVQTYSWDFKDGSTSSDSRPTHWYQNSGTYNAELTVTNAYGSHTDTVTVKAIVPSIKYIDFCDGEGDNEYPINDHKWPDVHKEAYAAYKKSTRPGQYVKLTGSDNLTRDDETVILKASYDFFYDSTDSSMNVIHIWENSNWFPLYGPNEVIPAIGTDAGSIDWSYQVLAGRWVLNFETTTHTIYVVYGSPQCGDSNYTRSHIADAVIWGDSQSSEPDIAEQVCELVNGGISSGCICASTFDYIWQGAKGDHSNGMCCCRAKGMSKVMDVLGVPGYDTIVYVNERPEPGQKNYNPINGKYCSTCNKICYRRAWWPRTPSGFWNNWEGACRSHGTGTMCYAPAGEFMGTYNQIRTQFGPYYWVWGPNQSNTCPHLSYP